MQRYSTSSSSPAASEATAMSSSHHNRMSIEVVTEDEERIPSSFSASCSYRDPNVDVVVGRTTTSSSQQQQHVEEGLLSTTSSLSPSKMIASLNNRGVSKFKFGSNEEALYCFHSCLHILDHHHQQHQRQTRRGDTIKYTSLSCIRSSDYPTASMAKAVVSPFLSPKSTNNGRKDHSTSNDSSCNESERREYDEGMQYFSSPIRIPIDMEEGGGITSRLMLFDDDYDEETIGSIIIYNMGLLYLRKYPDSNDADEEANECFQAALFLTRRNKSHRSGRELVSRQSRLEVALLHNIGYTQYRNSQLDKAIRTFGEALELFRPMLLSSNSKDSSNSNNEIILEQQQLQLAATLNCLGVLCFHLPKSATIRSMEYYMKSLEIRRHYQSNSTTTSGSCCSNQHQQHIATTLNNIGRVHYIKGEYDRALASYLEALRIRRLQLGKDHLDVAAVIYNSGQTYHQQGHFEKALRYYQEFMRIAIMKLGPNHRDVGIMLKCMAQIYHEQKVYEEAIQLYQRALHVSQIALGTTDHAEIASILNKMGNLYYERGDFDNALLRYQQGLEVERTILPSIHPNITVTLTNIGQIHKQRGDYIQALKMYRGALDIQVKTIGPAHPNVATTLSNMGLLHYQSKSYEKSLDIYQEALRIRRDAYGGDTHLEVASSLNSIGLVLFKLGHHQMAMSSFVESFKIRRQLLGDAHRDVAIILYNIATIHLERGEDEEALNCYQETLRIERSVLGYDHIDLILTLQYTARVYHQRGELNDALQCYQEILRIQQLHQQHDKRLLYDDLSSTKNRKIVTATKKNEHHTVVGIAKTLNSIANIHLQNGNTKLVVSTMSEAARIMKQVRGGQSWEHELRLSGFHLYCFAILHPECARAA